MDMWSTARGRAAGLLHTDPLLLDTVLALLMTGFGLRQAWQHYPATEKPFDAVALGLSVAANMSVAFRRRAPLAVLAFCCAVVGVYEASGYWTTLNQLGPQLAFSTVAALHKRAATFVGAAMVAPVLVTSNLDQWPNSAVDTVALTLLWIGVLWVVGDGVRRLGSRNRQLAEHTLALTELSRRLAHAQHEQARQAVVAERVRIARELHDVVAHHISVISVQAELARYVFEVDGATARRALGDVAAAGREALAEMRHLLAVLKPDPEAADGELLLPAPGLDRVPELVERIRSAGVPLASVVRGRPRPLGGGLELCAYRVIQESLTNIVKHARPRAATLTIDYRPRELMVSVVDDGGGDAPEGVSQGVSGGGHGLIGMAERARIYGGALSAGPRPGGGFEVVLTLPIDDVGDHVTTPDSTTTGDTGR